MKGIVALLVFLSSMIASPLARAQGQTHTKAIADQDLYSQALIASLREITKSWGHIDDSDNGTRIRTEWHNVIVEEYSEITDTMPHQIEDFHVEYLDHKGLIDRYKKLHKEYSILIVSPMKNEGQRLKITISNDWIKYPKRRLWYGVSDWSIVYFRYDCAKQVYVVDEVKLGGI